MKIAIDIDNVVCNTAECVCEQFNEYTGENLTINDIKSYYIENAVDPKYAKLIASLFVNKDTWKRLSPIKYCCESIRDLHNLGHEIYFATSTTSDNLKKKQNYLQRLFPYMDIDHQLIRISRKQLLDVDVLIDDYDKNFVGGKYIGIVLDYPWNRKFSCDGKHFFRAKDWAEVSDIINKISKD